jgi:CheY-like chemotaxis protein
VVDDERVVLLGMGHYFRAKGYDVDCAREREEAEALLAHHEYGCVIVDLRMTAAHGAEGLEIVALARERCPRAGIVVLTAYGSAAAEFEAKARGADLFLAKPQLLGDLAQDVAVLLGEKGA